MTAPDCPVCAMFGDGEVEDGEQRLCEEHDDWGQCDRCGAWVLECDLDGWGFCDSCDIEDEL